MHFLLRGPVMMQWWAELPVTDHFLGLLPVRGAVCLPSPECLWPIRRRLSVRLAGRMDRQTDERRSFMVPSGAAGHKSPRAATSRLP